MTDTISVALISAGGSVAVAVPPQSFQTLERMYDHESSNARHSLEGGVICFRNC